jgi:hypothetical protein
MPSLLKGWVYAVEDVNIKTKAEVVNPSSYLTLDAPLTHSKRKAVKQLDDPYRQHHWASNITKVPPISPSVSKRTAMKHWHVISKPTSTLPIPL